MKIFDTHCHLDILCDSIDFYNKILPSLSEIIQRNNIKYLTQISTDYDSAIFSSILPNLEQNKYTEFLENLSENFQNCLRNYQKISLPDICTIYYSIGLHPSSHNQYETLTQIEEFKKKKKNDKKFIGIGEIGLDYYWDKDKSVRDLQIDILNRSLILAKRINKPIIVHSRDAFPDIYEILKKNHDGNGIIHCFTGDLNWAKKFCDLGYMISFSGIVTFKNAVDIQNAAINIPIEHVLVESDSPYLAPVPYRGKTNTPAYVKDTLEHIARLRKINITLFAEKVLENSLRVFKIN